MYLKVTPNIAPVRNFWSTFGANIVLEIVVPPLTPIAMFEL